MSRDLADIPIAGDVPVTEDVHLHGPPGTGKTTQAMRRVLELVENHDMDIGDGAWVTYRHSLAVDDTLPRLQQAGILAEGDLLRPSRNETRYWGTMHSIGLRLLRDHPHVASDYLSADPSEIDVADYWPRVDFCKKLGITNYDGGPQWKDGTGELLMRVIDWVRHNYPLDISKRAVSRAPMYDDLRERWEGSVISAMEDWRDYLREREMIDYGEMLELPIKLGLSPNVDYMILDEIHDFTPLMVATAINWADDVDITVAAGDPHQLINQYKGPSLETYDYLLNQLNVDTHRLGKSHRVPQEHWSIAKQILSEVHQPPDIEPDGTGSLRILNSPSFRPQSGTGPTWKRGVPSSEDRNGPVDLLPDVDRSTMYLTRTQMQAQGIMRALDKGGVIYETQTTLDGGWVSGSAPLRDYRDPRLDLHNALQRIEGVEPPTGTYGLQKYGGGTPAENVLLSAGEASALLRHGPAKFYSETRSNLDSQASKIETQGSQVRLTDLPLTPEWYAALTRDAADAARELNKEWTDQQMDHISLIRACDRYERPVSVEEINTSVRTIHASKGAEASRVVLYDGLTRRPQESMRDPAMRANEYRTWYVACTRASRDLMVLQNAWQGMRTRSIVPDLPPSGKSQSTPADD